MPVTCGSVLTTKTMAVAVYIYYSEGGIGGSNQWVDVSQPNTSTLTQAIADDRYLRSTPERSTKRFRALVLLLFLDEISQFQVTRAHFLLATTTVTFNC